MSRLFAAAAVLALSAGGFALAQTAAVKPAPMATPAPAPAAMQQGPHGYLADGQLDTLKVLQPAPVAGTARYEADRRIFKETRALKDSDRWKLAQNDAHQTMPAVMKDFSCAVGVAITPENSPKLSALYNRMAGDLVRAVNVPKDFYKRQRPYLIDEGDICVDKTEGLAKSPDYPSGHSSQGWTVALILAELAPDRATPILIRGRSYGESRLVCGVHNASAVEQGRTNASALVAALHGSPEFRADMDGVRDELAALRRTGPKPEGCEAEAALIAKSPY